MTALLHRIEQTGSTQDDVHELAADGAPGGTAVLARVQGAGRGSRGQAWSSPAGGLWLSVLLRDVAPAALDSLAVRLGLAVAEALETLPGMPPLQLKWPNDLILADRKVGGVLAEARWVGEALAWVVAGIGINVRNDPPAGARMPAIALVDVIPWVTPADLVEPVLGNVRALSGAADGLSPEARAAFGRRDWLRGSRLAAPVAGVVEGIGADGQLRVRLADGALTEVRTGPVEIAAGART